MHKKFQVSKSASCSSWILYNRLARESTLAILVLQRLNNQNCHNLKSSQRDFLFRSSIYYGMVGYSSRRSNIIHSNPVMTTN
jgi:hypothetical protein